MKDKISWPYGAYGEQQHVKTKTSNRLSLQRMIILLRQEVTIMKEEVLTSVFMTKRVFSPAW